MDDTPAVGPVPTPTSASLPENAFRLLGLPGLASQMEIREAAAARVKAVRLGEAAGVPDPAELPGLPAMERDVESLKVALQRLTEPETRLRERLLWIFDETNLLTAAWHGSEASFTEGADPANAIDDHDACVLRLYELSHRDPATEDESGWRSLLKRWAKVVSRDELWEALSRAESEGGFDSAAGSAELRERREQALTDALTVPIARARSEAVERGDGSPLARLAEWLREVPGGSGPAEQLDQEVASLRAREIQELCGELRKEVAGLLKRGQGDPVSLRSSCDLVLTRFEREVEGPLEALVDQVGAEAHATGLVRNSAALLLNTLAAGYGRALAYDEGLAVLRRAEILALGSKVTARIQGSLRNMAERAENHAGQADLPPPPVDDRSEPVAAVEPSVAAASSPAARPAPWRGVAAGIAALLLGLAAGSPPGRSALEDLRAMTVRGGSSPSGGSSMGTGDPAAVAVPGHGATNRPGSPRGPSTAGADAPALPASPAARRLYTEITDERARMNTLDRRLGELDTVIDSLARRIDLYKVQLDDFEHRLLVNQPVEMEAYRTAIQDHNDLVDEYNDSIASRRSLSDAYRLLARRDSLLVGRYNELARKATSGPIGAGSP